MPVPVVLLGGVGLIDPHRRILRGPWPAGTRGISSLIRTLLSPFLLGASGVACGSLVRGRRLVLGYTFGAGLLLFVIFLELAPPSAAPVSAAVPRVSVAVGDPDHNWRRDGEREGGREGESQ